MRNAVILLTGAGSLGRALIPRLLERDPHAIRVLDSSEHALLDGRHALPDSRIRWILGDITNEHYVQNAMNGVDIVIHTAAVKTIEAAQYSPLRVLEVNIDGFRNMLLETWHARPRQFLFLSSDKGLSLRGIYHATKYLGEALTLWANNVRPDWKSKRFTRFSCFRPGNFLVSKSNVFEVWERQAKQGKPVTLTDSRMQRYFIDTDEVADILVEVLTRMQGGEIFVPRCQEYSVADLAREFARRFHVSVEVTGLRTDEGLREQLMTPDEKKRAIGRRRYWVIPSSS